MCRMCVTPDRIEEIERRHNVRWCRACNTYVSRSEAICPGCAERVREARARRRLGRTRLTAPEVASRAFDA